MTLIPSVPSSIIILARSRQFFSTKESGLILLLRLTETSLKLTSTEHLSLEISVEKAEPIELKSTIKARVVFILDANGFKTTVKDETVIVMKQLQSFGEAVLIDVNKRVVFSNGGEMRLGSSLKVLRKDVERPASSMSREELISFLSVSTCLLSFNGISHSMKKAIYELSAQATGSYAASENTLNL